MNGVITRLTDELYECKTCDKRFSGPASFAQHRDSDKHRRAVEKHRMCSSSSSLDSCGTPQQIVPPGNFIRCTPCGVDISGPDNLIQHKEGKRHKRAVAMLGQSAIAESAGTASTVEVTLTSVSPRDKRSMVGLAAATNSLMSLHLSDCGGRESDEVSDNKPHSLMSLHLSDCGGRESDEVCDNKPHSGSGSCCSSRTSTLLCPSFGAVEYASGPEDGTADSAADKPAGVLKNEARHSSLPPPKGEIRAPESISTETGGRVTFIDSASSIPRVRVEAEGYACFKCGILLFKDGDAALDHYRTDSHKAKMHAASEANGGKK